MKGDALMRRASDLYDELARLRSLLDFYGLYPFGSHEDRASFESLADALRDREREILKQLADLHKQIDSA